MKNLRRRKPSAVRLFVVSFSHILMGVVRKAEACSLKKTKEKNRFKSHWHSWCIRSDRSINVSPVVCLSCLEVKRCFQKVSSDDVQSFGFYRLVQGGHRRSTQAHPESHSEPLSTEDHLDHNVYRKHTHTHMCNGCSVVKPDMHRKWQQKQNSLSVSVSFLLCLCRERLNSEG